MWEADIKYINPLQNRPLHIVREIEENWVREVAMALFRMKAHLNKILKIQFLTTFQNN